MEQAQKVLFFTTMRVISAITTGIMTSRSPIRAIQRSGASREAGRRGLAAENGLRRSALVLTGLVIEGPSCLGDRSSVYLLQHCQSILTTDGAMVRAGGGREERERGGN